MSTSTNEKVQTTLMLTESEWLRKYNQRLKDRADYPGDASEDFGIPFDELSAGFEDDPEGAADEEMSYWEDDGE